MSTEYHQRAEIHQKSTLSAPQVTPNPQNITNNGMARHCLRMTLIFHPRKPGVQQDCGPCPGRRPHGKPQSPGTVTACHHNMATGSRVHSTTTHTYRCCQNRCSPTGQMLGHRHSVLLRPPLLSADRQEGRCNSLSRSELFHLRYISKLPVRSASGHLNCPLLLHHSISTARYQCIRENKQFFIRMAVCL